MAHELCVDFGAFGVEARSDGTDFELENKLSNSTRIIRYRHLLTVNKNGLRKIVLCAVYKTGSKRETEIFMLSKYILKSFSASWGAIIFRVRIAGHWCWVISNLRPRAFGAGAVDRTIR